MKLTRRNALIGLGSLVAGSGALVGTGAFSSVEADRTVALETAGDGSAQLGLNITDADLAGSGDTINFQLGNGVNLNATTRFDGAFEITNNGDEAVTIGITDGSSNSLVDTDTGLEFEPQTTGDLDSGTTRTYDVVFNLGGITSQDDATIVDSITITANSA